MTDVTRFIVSLKRYRRKVPTQALKTLRGQALAGDLDGARAGLVKLALKYDIQPKRG